MISFNYLIHNECLLRVDQVEDLGFTLMSSLSFNNHIEFITCKVLRILEVLFVVIHQILTKLIALKCYIPH
jgi:hypothetical protein